ncbi:MAG: calcium/sodium antiporter [Planctomycetes bacterium]|nr:calcium/sodium antiporter [Planctomycetota bacterium]
MWLSWLLIVAGLLALLVGAELLVRGSAWIAEALGVRKLVVGLTVVAIGTSAPELVVSMIAACQGEVGIVLGNVYGSNIANIALILGVVAALRAIRCDESKLRFETVWLLLASALAFVPFALGSYVRPFGVVLVGLICAFLALLVKRERAGRPPRPIDHTPRPMRAWMVHIGLVLAGLAALVQGGSWLVDGAVEVAKAAGVSSTVIAATIVAIGTSLPELATSVVAARRGHPELAVGNVVGSNIFNVLMVLGVTASVTPVPVSWAADGMRTTVAMVATVLLAWLLLGPRRIARPVGVTFLIGYAVYLLAEVEGWTLG